MGQEIRIKASDGSGDFAAYLATPASGRVGGPAIIVIQEIFGVNADLRAKCNAWAAQGYVAISPDLFWRQEPGVQITPKNEADWQRAFNLYQAFNVDKGIEDVQASIAVARAQGSDKVGTVGYCLGGLLAYLCATRTDADANVSYYGVGIEKQLGEAAKIHTPLMLHIASADEYVPPEAQAQIHAALAGNPKVVLHDYADQKHAFSRSGGDHYHAPSATLANERTAALFAKVLAA
jgi:carboxymethylenebutenolidase